MSTHRSASFCSPRPTPEKKTRHNRVDEKGGDVSSRLDLITDGGGNKRRMEKHFSAGLLDAVQTSLNWQRGHKSGNKNGQPLNGPCMPGPVRESRRSSG